MPTYDYRCEHNGQVYEVRHPMSLTVVTWEDLCKVASLESGDIPANSAVTKLLRTGGVMTGSSSTESGAASCSTGSGCKSSSCCP
ncbi:MAG: zinc ribbon domain-containing protein [Pseudomonadota bacterium]